MLRVVSLMVFLLQATKSVSKPGKVVAKILAEKGIVKYCLEFLESLLPYWRQMKTTFNVN